MNEFTEGLERFNKIVSALQLYVTPEDQNLIDTNELGENEDGVYPAVYAYVSEECATNNRGFLIALIDEQVYTCYETEYINETLYCSGSVPAWSIDDNSLIQMLSEKIRDYKSDLIRKRKLKMFKDFE